MVGEYATATNIAQSVQGQLSEIGVELDLQQQQTNVYVDNWLEANYDAAVALNGGSTDPYLMYGRYYTEGASLAKPAGLSRPAAAPAAARGQLHHRRGRARSRSSASCSRSCSGSRPGSGCSTTSRTTSWATTSRGSRR